LERRVQVTAQVAEQVGKDQAVGEAPNASDAREGVVVAAGDDRLEGEVGTGLEHGEVRGRGRGGAGGVDGDGPGRDDVLRRGDAVVEDDAVVGAPDLVGTA